MAIREDVKMKATTIMEQADLFKKMREDFLHNLAVHESQSPADSIEEIARVIRGKNADDHKALIIFLNAICSTSPKRLQLLQYVLVKKNKRLWQKLLKLGFRHSVLSLSSSRRK